MAGKFNTYIDNINPEFWRDFLTGEGELRSYAKGEEFVSVGSVCRYIGHIRSGACKYVAYADDGTEHVVGLIFPGEFVADFPFLLFGRPARVSIVATEPSEIHVYSASDFARRMKADSRLTQMVVQATNALYSTVYDRLLAFYTRSAVERYRELITRHPGLFNTFSLKDIASFLNITPTHLSRLRKS